jgi:hypothetical protein
LTLASEDKLTCEKMNAVTSLPDYLTVGQTCFARTPALLTESLFRSGGTANGSYKVRKNGVLFLKPCGAPFAFLVANPHREPFFVSCFRQDDGRVRYMFSTCGVDEVRLGIAGLGYSAERAEASRVWDACQSA